MANIQEAAKLIPKEPPGPKPGQTVLYRGGEILYFNQAQHDLFLF
ncbi:hypothetical protein b3_0135 [Synechococcus phage B3]|nr:hypothetical protein b3_0135 [Synechococcus phage B3]QGT54749.1 hypothetical protein b23_0134 [Synechococcus phage B23]